MSTATIISIILGALGMISGIVFNFYRTNKVLKENEYKNVINSQRADISTFRGEIKELHGKIENLNNMIRELDSALLRSNAISLAFPFPFWYKYSDGKMMMLNDEYCKTYHRCREDYLGKTDYDVWDKETADLYKKNDELTLNSQLGYTVTHNSEVDDTMIIKWRIPGLAKNEYYIAGIAVPFKTIEDVRRTT